MCLRLFCRKDLYKKVSLSIEFQQNNQNFEDWIKNLKSIGQWNSESRRVYISELSAKRGGNRLFPHFVQIIQTNLEKRFKYQILLYFCKNCFRSFQRLKATDFYHFLYFERISDPIDRVINRALNICLRYYWDSIHAWFKPPWDNIYVGWFT